MRCNATLPSLRPLAKAFCAFLLVLNALQPPPGFAEVLSPPSIATGYGLALPGASLRCYFSGRWITPNLGAASIEVTGSSMVGVSRRFDNSMARNLYEMHFNALVSDSSRSASGTQNYRFLTGFFPASYSGSINFRLLRDINQLEVTYSNGFFTFEEVWVKTKSGECS